MTKSFLKVQGINHDRFVGISKDDGKAYDFYILNIGGYRPPQTVEEKAACKDRAFDYWLECDKWRNTTGAFDADYVKITPNLIEQACHNIY